MLCAGLKMKTPKSGEATAFPLGDILAGRALDHFHGKLEKANLPEHHQLLQ
jgi:hypothetical protein